MAIIDGVELSLERLHYFHPLALIAEKHIGRLSRCGAVRWKSRFPVPQDAAGGHPRTSCSRRVEVASPSRSAPGGCARQQARFR